MTSMITPMSIWKSLDCSLPTNAVCIGGETIGDTVIEYLTVSGRETGEGRVEILLAFAYSSANTSDDALLILPDSNQGIDKDVLTMFVNKGYCVCMVDYRGEIENQPYFTHYPANVAYANVSKSERYMHFVDKSAEITSWFEWGAVALYARKYLAERTENEDVAVIGIRDGGEIMWKILNAGKFSCAVAVSAAGWKAYNGYHKFEKNEPDLDEERYRFIAGIDSQAYAPYVGCPVLMLCTVNDSRFDCDRAYDTFARINPEYAENSAIVYAMKGNGYIDQSALQTTYMFLDKFVRNRQVFIPSSCEVTLSADNEQNLCATTENDDWGIVESCKLYFAEDCFNSAVREWRTARVKNVANGNYSFYLDIHEKTSNVFVVCSTTYSNGFTVWSRVYSRKVGGAFKNSQPNNKIIYAGNHGADAFISANIGAKTIGNIFIQEDTSIQIVKKAHQICGIYSPYGLSTYRIGNKRCAVTNESILKLDVYTDDADEITLHYFSVHTQEEYQATIHTYGEIWQSELLDCKCFKNNQGMPLTSFEGASKLIIYCDNAYAINNVMWL